MARVTELSDPYANFMLAPRHGAGVCRTCLNLTRGFDRCYACAQQAQWLDVVAPISYSVAHEQLHHALASYKRPDSPIARRFTVELAAVLWRHLARHEACAADAVGVPSFPLVTTVPSGQQGRDREHPLRRIVGELVAPSRSRYEHLLVRSEQPVAPRTFHPDKFAAARRLAGEPVLLIDDTWTTGANAQSAACALKTAGAGPVAAIVLGRHVNRDWDRNDARLRRLAHPFDWNSCVLCPDLPAALVPASSARARPDASAH